MNWLTVLVLGIIIYFAFRGRRVGFIKNIFSICSIVLAIIIASSVSPSVSKALRSNEKFYNFVNEKVDGFVVFNSDKEEEQEENNKEEDKISVGQQMKEISNLPIPEVFKNKLAENKNNLEVYKALKVKNFHDYVTGYISMLIINAIAFLLSYLIAMVIVRIICQALNIISKLPVINGLNKTAGLLVGVFQGLLVVWILCIVLTIFSSTNAAQDLYTLIEESQILSGLYNNNLLLQGVMNMAKVLF